MSEGPHLGYAVQWFVFATVLLLGYPRYLWQQARAAGAHPATAQLEEPI